MATVDEVCTRPFDAFCSTGFEHVLQPFSSGPEMISCSSLGTPKGKGEATCNAASQPAAAPRHPVGFSRSAS